MEFSSKILEKAVDEVSQLPGIGKRTALRLVLHLLKQPKEQVKYLTEALDTVRNNINYCKKCHNISDFELCEICSNPKRNQDIICVVEDIRDVMAIEHTACFNGVYHVLGGKISPMEGISPSMINIKSLLDKINFENISEIIFALSATIEGDTTIYYIYKQLNNLEIKISTIARGLAVGDALEYADEVTLSRSILQRIPYQKS
ncbi:MAG: recombination mediator RecR [Flavobacterium sp.]